MTSFLNRLLDRNVGRGRVVQPLIRSLFSFETPMADPAVRRSPERSILSVIKEPEAESIIALSSRIEPPALQRQAMESNNALHHSQTRSSSLSPVHNSNAIKFGTVASNPAETRQAESVRNPAVSASHLASVNSLIGLDQQEKPHRMQIGNAGGTGG